MKKITGMLNKIIIILFLLISVNLSSQLRFIPTPAFKSVSYGSGFILDFESTDKGAYLKFVSGQYDNEIQSEIVDDFNFVYFKGITAYKRNDFGSAKKYLSNYISRNIPYDDTVGFWQKLYYVRVYKNDACSKLKKIYLDEKDYGKSIYFHKLQDMYSLYEMNCVPDSKKPFEKDLFLIDTYIKSCNYDEALSLLSRHVGFLHDDGMVSQRADSIFIELLLKKYSKKEIQESLQAGIRNSYPLYNFYFVVNLVGYELFFESMSLQKITGSNNRVTNDEIFNAHKNFNEEIKQNNFYKLIMEN